MGELTTLATLVRKENDPEIDIFSNTVCADYFPTVKAFGLREGEEGGGTMRYLEHG